MSDLILTVLQDAFWSAIAATGFAMLFNVPRRTLLGCAITGAIGHAIRTFVMQQFHLPIEIATLIGATVVGFIAYTLAQRLHVPATIFSVSGSIPLVPGLFAYSAMISFIRLTLGDPSTAPDGLLLDAVVNTLKTGAILGAIAAGIVLPVLLLNRTKPVV